MRIGLNLLPVRQGIGGTWNYIEGLLGALAQHSGDHEYVVFATSSSEALVPKHPRFRTVSVPVPATIRPARILYEHTLLRGNVRGARLDCLHHVFGTLPLAAGLPTVVTIYDLIEFERPSDFGPVKRRYLRVMRRRAAERATILAPMSHSTATDLQNRLGVEPERMQVVLPALAEEFAPQSTARIRQIREQWSLPSEFWLAVGDPLPRKNLPRLLEALAVLRGSRAGAWPLVIRGTADDELRERARELGLDGHVFYLPQLSTSDMAALYGAASALVFPSHFEGGGLPLVEALACGCPVVASDIATTHEFAGEAAITFDPARTDSMAAAMLRCEEDASARRERAALGLGMSGPHRPAAVASSCVLAYERALGIESR